MEVVVADRMDNNSKVDLISVIEQKRKALLSHQSQFSRELVEEILSEMREGDTYFEKLFYFKLAW